MPDWIWQDICLLKGVMRSFMVVVLALGFQAVQGQLHWGGMDIHAQGDSVVVPFNLANPQGAAPDSLFLVLSFPEEKLELKNVALSSSQADRWELEWEPNGPGRARVSLRDSKAAKKGPWLEMLRLTWGLGSLADSAVVEAIELKATGIDVGVPSASSFILRRGFGPWQDLDGNGELSFSDAQFMFQELGRSMKGASSADVMELSGYSRAGAHDVGLFVSHVLGLSPAMQPRTSNSFLAPPIRVDAQLQISSGEALVGVPDVHVYTLKAMGIQGLSSAEVALSIDPGIVAGVVSATFSSAPILTQSFHLGQESYRLAAVWAPAIETPEEDWLRLVVRHRPGITGQGILAADTALLNEGAIRGNFVSSSLVIPQGATVPSSPNIRHAWKPELRWEGRTLVLMNPHASAGWLSITDSKGRKLFNALLPPERLSQFALDPLPGGNIILHLELDGRRQSFSLPALR